MSLFQSVCKLKFNSNISASGLWLKIFYRKLQNLCYHINVNYLEIFKKSSARQGWQYGTVRSEFAYYVPRTLNRTVPAYHTSVKFLKRTISWYRTSVP